MTIEVRRALGRLGSCLPAARPRRRGMLLAPSARAQPVRLGPPARGLLAGSRPHPRPRRSLARPASPQGPSLVVHHPDEVLDNMNDWCKEHHGKSGLTQRVRSSSTTMQQAEDAVLAFIQSYVPDAKRAQLAGNSVHNDRVFLMRYMPRIVDHLDHRIVDVSAGRPRWLGAACCLLPALRGAALAGGCLLPALVPRLWVAACCLRWRCRGWCCAWGVGGCHLGL
jgi:hypothetical protein